MDHQVLELGFIWSLETIKNCFAKCSFELNNDHFVDSFNELANEMENMEIWWYQKDMQTSTRKNAPHLQKLTPMRLIGEVHLIRLASIFY